MKRINILYIFLIGVFYMQVAQAKFTAIAPTPTKLSSTSSKGKTMTTTAQTAARITQTLEIVGLGLTVEMFRQDSAWQAMGKLPNGKILPTDPKKYPWSEMEKDLVTNKRIADTLEAAGSYLPEYWRIPGFPIWSPLSRPRKLEVRFEGEAPSDWYGTFFDDIRKEAGMHHHKFKQITEIFHNDPDYLLEQVFRFFDTYPAVPMLVVYVSGNRSATGNAWRDERDLTESKVCLVFAKRSRVKFMQDYFYPPSTANMNFSQYSAYQQQLRALQAAGKPLPGQVEFVGDAYLPKLWTIEQITAFNRLPTFGIVHRPFEVSYLNATPKNPKKPRLSNLEQQQAFQAAFDQALAIIPGGKPARIFFDHGDATKGRQIIPLSLAVAHSLPHEDLFDPHYGYNLFTRLGDTNVASPLVQWALGVIASNTHHDTSMTVHLRHPDRATITVITPPPAVAGSKPH